MRGEFEKAHWSRGGGIDRGGLAHQSDEADPHSVQSHHSADVDEIACANERGEVSVAAEVHVRGDNRGVKSEGMPGGQENASKAPRRVIELVVAQRHDVIVHKVHEQESERQVTEREVVNRAHGPVAGVDQDDRMTRRSPYVIYVSSDAVICADGARAVDRIDVEADMVRTVGVVVEIGRLQNGDLTGSLRCQCKRERERDEEGREGHAKHESHVRLRQFDWNRVEQANSITRLGMAVEGENW